MSLNLSEENFGVEIDFRQILQTLLRYKWVLLVVTLVFGVLGYIFFSFQKPKYQATVYVMVGQPASRTNLDARIQESTVTTDLASLTLLAKSSEIVDQVYAELEATGVKRAALPPIAFDVLTTGTSHLRLNVTSTNPEMAAQAANIWAQKVASRLNALYGLDESQLDQLAGQRAAALGKWNEAEQELADYLPQSPRAALAVSVLQAEATLKVQLEKISILEQTILDAQTLDAQLQDRGNAERALTGDMLTLITLQQESVSTGRAEATGFQVQFPLSASTDIPMTVGEVRANLQSLVEALENQRSELITGLPALEEKIAQLHTDLAAATYRENFLIIQRDAAQNAYQTIVNREEEVRLSLSEYDRPVKVSSQAVVPGASIATSPATGAVIAGLVGLALASGAVLFLSWWGTAPQVKADLRALKSAEVASNKE